MTSLHLVPPEKDDVGAKGSTFTATLRGSSVPELEEHVERLRRSHGFGPSQAAQWLVQLAIDMRNALGSR